MKKQARALGSVRARLLVSHIGVSLMGILVLFVTVRLAAPSFFDQHVGNMFGVHGGGPGAGMGVQAAEVDAALDRSLNEGFLLAAAVALPLSVAASMLVARAVAKPVRSLASASQRIASGDYHQRVGVGGPAELADLGASFNTMAEALESVEQRRVALIGDIAHELRTPVTVLRGYVEGLADGIFAPTPDTWAKLDAETARLSRLVEELQDLSRAEAGQLPVTVAPMDALAAANTAAQRFAVAFAEKGIRLDVLAADGPQLVLGDQDRVVQVLSILLDNALRYTPAPGTVAISIRAEAEGVAIAVADSGLGIASEHLPHVFERFYRVDRSRARASGGSGIGLTIARAVAGAMGGSLVAESAGASRGSTFTLRLRPAPVGTSRA